MEYKGYWAVGVLTFIAGGRLAGRRRQILTRKCRLLYQALDDADLNLVSDLKSTNSSQLMETTSSRHTRGSKVWLIC